MSNSLPPYGLQPARFLCPWNFPGNWRELPLPTPGYLPDPGIEIGSPALQADSLLLKHQRSSKQYRNTSNADYNVFSNFGIVGLTIFVDTLYQLIFCISCVIAFSKSYMLRVNFILFFFKFYFIFKLYNIVLVLPNIEMNPPQVYLCSPC